MIFTMTIGDWSGDGHENAVNFLVETDKDLEAVREAHFLIAEKYGINIEDLCDQSDAIPADAARQLTTIGFDLQKVIWDEDDDGCVYMTIEGMADLWLFLLNKADPGLRLHFIHCPDLHFSGKDENGRHIGAVGYGLCS